MKKLKYLESIKIGGFYYDTVTDPRRIKWLYDRSFKGYYLTTTDIIDKLSKSCNVDDYEFILFDATSDKTLYNYIETKLGKKNKKNSDEWDQYVVIDTTKMKHIIYSW